MNVGNSLKIKRIGTPHSRRTCKGRRGVVAYCLSKVILQPTVSIKLPALRFLLLLTAFVGPEGAKKHHLSMKLSEYSINCILRVFAEVCYSKLSLNPSEVVIHEHAMYSRENRLFQCYQYIGQKNGLIIPSTMHRGDFLKRFATLKFEDAIRTVVSLDQTTKEEIGNYILYIIDKVQRRYFLYTEDLRLVEKIVNQANMQNTTLQLVALHTKELEVNI